MKLVVTGSAGFIGQNFVLKALDEGYDVVGIDLKPKPSIFECERYEHFQFSVTNQCKLELAFQDADACVHLAAQTSVATSKNRPIETLDVNLIGTINVIDAMKKQRNGQIIFASSASIYGSTDILPISENHNKNPQSPYAISKLLGEIYANRIAQISDLNTVCLRFFNVYGMKPTNSLNDSGVIGQFIQECKSRNVLSINGKGTQTRDFIHVDDVVDSIMRSLKYKGSATFNIGSGVEISIKELAKMISNLAGGVQCVYNKSGHVGVSRSVADISKAQNDLGWNPIYNLNENLSNIMKEI